MLIRLIACAAAAVPALDIALMLVCWQRPELLPEPVVLGIALAGLVPVGLAQWKGKDDPFVQKLRRGIRAYLSLCQWGSWMLCIVLSQLAREQLRIQLLLCIAGSIACAVLYWRPGAIGKQKKFG